MFFFTSRRRHTRCSRDWSSDVCSSDLLESRRGRLGYGGACGKGIRLRSGHNRRAPDRKSVRVGKECRSRWSPYHSKKKGEKLHRGFSSSEYRKIVGNGM